MPNLALGIDTGGTFTDGVIFDLDQKTVIAATKVETTRHNLTLAINSCIDNLVAALEKEKQGCNNIRQVKMVSLSTTLATNAIVEGQGAEVGLIQIGFEPTTGLPTPYYAVISGGCTIKGRFKAALDRDEAGKAITAMKDQVDAFAVSGYLSIRNPQQEIEVGELVRKLTGYPVVLAHQLSSDLGMLERTVTAVLNARLMPLITNLLNSVKEGMERQKIEAPLMVVRGDGSLISEMKAREKPIETILSGPAASITGALTLTGIREGIVIDMGGTTTDVAVLKDGRPALNREGAEVGGWLTRVKAAKITTIGLGGDSLIQVSRNAVLQIGPQRVFPLSWIATRHPYLNDELSAVEPLDYVATDTHPATILTYIRDPLNMKLSDTENRILDLIREGPHTLHYLGRKLQKEIDLLPWQRLVNTAAVHRASLTPTDILHVSGQLAIWDRRAAELGTCMLAARYRAGSDQFIKTVMDEIMYRLAAITFDRLLAEEGLSYNFSGQDSGKHLIRKILGITGAGMDKQITFSSKFNYPLIAVGAPVEAYFPALAGRLQAELFMPCHADVANAIGTVSGKAVERITVLVKPGEGGGFIVHTPQERATFVAFEEAIDFACKEGLRLAGEQAAENGAVNVETMLERQDRYSALTVSSDKGNPEQRIFIESTIEVAAVGRPWNE